MRCNVLSSFDPRWDQFVEDQSEATFFHQWKWRALLHDIFGYEPHYLSVETGDQITGSEGHIDRLLPECLEATRGGSHVSHAVRPLCRGYHQPYWQNTLFFSVCLA